MTQIPIDPPASAGARQRSPAERSLRLRLVAVALLVALAIPTLRWTGALDYLTFAALAEHRETLAAQVNAHGLLAPLVFLILYALSTALSLPTGLFLSMLGGFLFGTLWGGALNVIGATLGATAIFLAARTVLGEVLRARAGPFLQKLEAGFRRDALSYMLVLRLVPLFPFWLVNLAPAFLGVRPSTFIGGTLIGIVPGAFIFASVGTGLGAILDNGGTPDGSVLLQPHVLLPIIGLALLALIPVIAKRVRRPALPQEKTS